MIAALGACAQGTVPRVHDSRRVIDERIALETLDGAGPRRVRDVPPIRALDRWWMARHDYEEEFSRRLLASVGADTVVWDIGANVGLYTQQLLDAGARSVVCFEPAPDSIEALRTRFAAVPDRVTVLGVALADSSGTASFSADGSSATNRLNPDGASAPGNTVQVRVMRADEVCREFRVPAPSVVKIDVEGFEIDVIRGMGAMLDAPELKKVFVEVHFRALHLRGLDGAPLEIENRLAAAGFSVRWLDLSHLWAVRD
jgi:FkbM family methyltransferase